MATMFETDLLKHCALGTNARNGKANRHDAFKTISASVLKHELSTIKLGTDSVKGLKRRMDDIVDELNLAHNANYTEQDVFCQLCMALPSEYQTIARHLIASPEMDMKTKFEELCKWDVKNRKQKEDKKEEKKNGRKHESQESWKPRTCHLCHEEGHMKRDCPKNARDESKSQSSETLVEEPAPQKKHTINVVVTSGSSYSPELQLLKNVVTPPETQYLRSILGMGPIYVCNRMGELHLPTKGGPDVVIKDVYYVPDARKVAAVDFAIAQAGFNLQLGGENPHIGYGGKQVVALNRHYGLHHVPLEVEDEGVIPSNIDFYSPG